jgi:hypothetical protein
VDVVATGAKHVDVRIEGRSQRVSAILAEAIFILLQEAGAA